MRIVRWLIPFVVLMSTLLACFATTPDEDDSSVPMSTQSNRSSLPADYHMQLPTFTASPSPTITPGPSPTPYPTTDPASFGPSTTSDGEDGGGGVPLLLVLAIVMVLLLGAFAAVIRKNPRRSKPKE